MVGMTSNKDFKDMKVEKSSEYSVNELDSALLNDNMTVEVLI